MRLHRILALLIVLVCLSLSVPVVADDGVVGEDVDVITMAETVAADEAAPTKGPPLPLHCIEGYGGGAITPVAYLVNPGGEGVMDSLPTAGFTFIDLGSKELTVFTVTQVFFDFIEVGYAFNRLNLGNFHSDVRRFLGADMGRDHVMLHHFNLRVNVIKEGSFDLPLPAITAGIHFKYNDGIGQIDGQLGNALKSYGYRRHWGIDYTITATKMFPTLAFGRPVILTGGLRLSNAAQLGYLGFGDSYHVLFEGSVLVMPTDNIVLAYEFRMKENPYQEIRAGGKTLLGDEDHWHMFSATWVVTNRLTVTGMYGLLGNIANARADCSFGFQIKYEF